METAGEGGKGLRPPPLRLEEQASALFPIPYIRAPPNEKKKEREKGEERRKEGKSLTPNYARHLTK